MDHKKYQNWVSGIDELTPPQKEQAQDLMSGVTGENASLMAIEAQLGRISSMSALQGIRSSFQRHGTGDATLPVQGLQEDLQRSNRHSVAGPS